eukprot:CAMPEP_0194193962 /NCGR_PEP_ID=MMETSP0154-20130528/75322_1 /TAXON_ID=1049557 /ORGANISM="Thalassiothrix antarctica, Strain L6-D1" /LENGTH=791 /DNA_ID=CAMNT_0038918345 /DNA_START=100 /DNA_END=2476 /DNA_ORIENTATION=-
MNNPFDQFSADVKAALPGVPPQGLGGPPPQGAGGGLDAFSPYPAPVAPSPARPQQPVMNAPPPQMYGQPNGYPPQNPRMGAPPPPSQQANPFEMSSQQPSQQPLPQQIHRQPSGQLHPPNQLGQQINRQPSQQSHNDQNSFGAPHEQQQMVPIGAPPNQYGMPPPPTDAGNPFGAPAAVGGDPFGAPPVGPPARMAPLGPPQGAQPAQPSGMGGQPGGMGGQPGGMGGQGGQPGGQPGGMGGQPGGMTAQPQVDPWGSSMPQQPPQYPPQQSQQLPPSDAMYGALVPAQPGPPAGDPFSVFNSVPAQGLSQAMAPPQQPVGDFFGQQPPPSHAQRAPSAARSSTNSGDVFAEMGFGGSGPGPRPTNSDGIFDAPVAATEPGQHKEGELPPGGEWYDARIFTPTLGVMFFKPQELTDSLFLNTDREIVDALEERPVVAFIVEGSSARSAGVELGHVLLKVNGVDVRNPKEASRLIKEGPRPLPLLFYVPHTEVVVAEGEHMVKYDTRDTTAPNSAKDWKPKYVVIGGIIAQPWMMNMYRSKSEYDIAVIETQARRPVSVKVKQFSLQGARIQNDWQGPQMVKYKNKLHPWKYIVILPVARNPIKISSPNLSQLKPVHEGIRRVLLAQQRDRGSSSSSAAPVRGSGGDPYSRNGSSRTGGSSRQDSYNRAPAPPRQTHAPAPPPPPPQQDLIGGFDAPIVQQPPNHHGVPPHQPPANYGGHSPQYGAPPPQPGYGAPPPQYSAPPPPSHQAQHPPHQAQHPPHQAQHPPQQNYAQNPSSSLVNDQYTETQVNV